MRTSLLHSFIRATGLAVVGTIPFLAEAAAPLPNSTVASNYFFTVHSNASSLIWVAPPTWRVMRDTAAPAAGGSGIDLYAARNEYEPVQVVTRATGAGTRSLSLGATWTGPSGNVIAATLHDVSYGATACATGDPDRLNPIAFGSAQTVCVNSNQAFWLTVFVPTNALPGVYSNTLTCGLPGLTTNFPIRVHVFNFTLPAETAFGSFVYWSFTGTPTTDLEMKRWLAQHRLTPSVVTYPSAMIPSLTWDTSANPNPCGAFYDEGDQPAAYGIRWLAHQFVAGVGFNDGVGFPNFITHQLVSNLQPRPSTFCGQSIAGDPRGADYGTAAYNAAWGSYLAALQNYCDPNVSPNNGGNPFGHDYLSKAAYFVMNEPQNTTDYNLAAWLAQLSRQYAPKLRLMISVEAKPEIFNNPLYPNQGYDIWVAHLPTYSTAIGNALARRRDHGEQTWWYSVTTDPPHFINPNQANRPAIETRILTWLAWQHRVEGWFASPDDSPMATFLGGSSFAPTIRSELLREAFEDYEYFKLANDGLKAQPFQPNLADKFVSPIAGTMTGYDRDPSKLHWLRMQLGKQLAGETVTAPLLPVAEARPYGSYYFNFQDPASFPTANPLNVNGRTWTKMGWQLYDQTNAAGWFVTSPGTLIYGWASTSSSNELQRSYIYDDFEWQVTFKLGLANGVYDVEAGVGRPGGASLPLLTVNGQNFFGDRLANLQASLNGNAAVTQRVAVVHGSLVMEAGRQIGAGYTLLNYLGITGVSPSSPDGLDDLWQTANFGSATNALAAPSADPDGDGANNFAEFHFGTLPNSGGSRPFLNATLPSETKIQLQWSSASNHVFRLEQSTNLIAWTTAVPQFLATNSLSVATLPRIPGSPQGFFRIVPIAP